MKQTRAIGFTLVELLVVLAIAGILAASAMPSFVDLVHRNQATQSVNAMFHLFNFARSEAARRKGLVTICPSSDQLQCETDWNLPLMVFADEDNNRSRSNDEELLRIHDHTSYGRWTMRPASKSYFQYTSMGFAHGTLGSLLFCHQSESPKLARRLFLSMAGRLRMSLDKNKDGIHEDNDGTALQCADS